MSLYAVVSEIQDIFQSIFVLDEGAGQARRTFVETGKISEEDFNKLLELDPTRHKKYIDWACFLFTQDKDISKFAAIAKFDDLATRNIIDNKDIRSYHSIDELAAAVHDKEGTLTTSQVKRGVKDFSQIDPADIVFKNDKAIVVQPKTEEKSILYGRGTNWCTAAMSNDNMFDSYVNFQKKNLFYVFALVNADSLGKGASKIGVLVSPYADRQFWSKNNTEMGEEEATRILRDGLGIPMDTFFANPLSEPYDEVSFENARAVVYRLNTHEDAVKHGAGTKWSISVPGSEGRYEFVRLYAAGGYSFYVIVNKRTGSRTIVSIHPREDRDGRTVDDKKFYTEDDIEIPKKESESLLRSLGVPI